MKIKNIIVSIFCCVFVLSFLPGCSTTIDSAARDKALRMSFDGIEPLLVNAGSIDIVNNYDPAADPRDMSSQFSAQPDVAFRRFAEKRLQAAGMTGVLRVTIENASIHHRRVAPEGRWGEWLNVGGSDEYQAYMQLRLSVAAQDNFISGPSSILRFRRRLNIPDSTSVAEREAAQIGLISALISDADKAMADVLKNKLGLLPVVAAVPAVDIPAKDAPASKDFVKNLLAAPEMR